MIMRKQLTLYIQRRLSKALIKEDLTPAAVLPALKWMLIEISRRIFQTGCSNYKERVY
jgi:hypothetical protein